jgi:hypothetical protein
MSAVSRIPPTAVRGGTISVMSEAAALFSTLTPAPDAVLAEAPVGPVVDAASGKWGLATATFSADRLHRFRLSRIWDAAGARVNFLMLNPSTADAFELDPTVRRCIGFAQAWGAGALEVTNAYALRSTQPSGLRAVPDPVGAGNDDAIVAAARAADIVVAAWGVHATYLGRGAHVRALLADAGVELMYLRLTKDGHPGHPLYVPASTVPASW